MKCVLITRPEPGATETAAKVSARGIIPIVAPVMSIHLREVRAPNSLGATILTSRNGALSCSPSVYSRPAFAVGTATADEASRIGFSTVFNADGDASALVNLVATISSPATGTLFLPTARGQGHKLAASLRQRGFRVLRRVAYDAAVVNALPDAAIAGLKKKLVTAAMFFSGEAAHHFVSLVYAANMAEAVSDVEAVSISERASVALRSLPWRHIRVAAKPTQDAMLALL